MAEIDFRQERARLNTRSVYHQFIRHKRRGIIARYTKTRLESVSFWRQHPDSSDETITGLLITNDNNEWFPFFGPEWSTEVCQINLWNYDADVIELYEGIDDINLFEDMNRVLLDDNILVPYDENTVYSYSNRTGTLVEDIDRVETTKEAASIISIKRGHDDE